LRNCGVLASNYLQDVENVTEK